MTNVFLFCTISKQQNSFVVAPSVRFGGGSGKARLRMLRSQSGNLQELPVWGGGAGGDDSLQYFEFVLIINK